MESVSVLRLFIPFIHSNKSVVNLEHDPVSASLKSFVLMIAIVAKMKNMEKPAGRATEKTVRRHVQ